MFQYFMTLGIYSIILFFILCILTIKKLPENIGSIINITIWYTVLNFANIFPWLGFGHMNWTGKLLVFFIVIFTMVCKRLKNENGCIDFVFDNGNKKSIITAGIVYIAAVVSVLALLLAHGKFDIERFLMNIILVGISEELYFRGLIYKKLLGINKHNNSKYTSIIICSVAFAVTHVYFFRLSFMQNIINFILPFLAGFLLNVIYKKTRNILVPILVHNSIDTIYYGIYTIVQIYFFKLGGN